MPPIVFQGGVSKNEGVTKYFSEVLKEDIIVDPNSHLMGAIGIALLAHKYEDGKMRSLDVADITFETKGRECEKCSNHCEILRIYKDSKFIESWGSKCGKVS